MELSDGTLIIEPPAEVRFNGPFARPIMTTLTLINPTDFKIIFKIKTTAPTFYGVRPNFGAVQPRNFTEVEIMRKPLRYDSKDQLNHKFMVESLIVPSHTENLNQAWENADQSQKKASKLKCVFEIPAYPDDLIKPKETSEAVLRLSRNKEKPETVERTAPVAPIEPIAPIAPITPIPPNKMEMLNVDLSQLRVENNELRKENLLLREEIDQLGVLRASKLQTSVVSVRSMSDKSEVPMAYVIGAVTLAIVCILIGRYIL